MFASTRSPRFGCATRGKDDVVRRQRAVDDAHRGVRAARNARNNAYMNLATQLASVFGAGVYTKDELQSAVCTYVNDMKKAGETGDAVVIGE